MLPGCSGRRSADPEVISTVSDDSVSAFMAAIAEENWVKAHRLSSSALIGRPGDPDLLTDAARAAAGVKEFGQAATLLVEAAQTADFAPATRVTFAVQALVDVGDIYASIDLLKASLARHPEDSRLRRMLTGFLNEVQRPEEIPEHLMVLIQQRSFDLPLLLTTTDTSTRRLSEKTAGRLLERNPDDRRVRLAEAFVHRYRGDLEQAAEVLEDIIHHHADFAPAYSMYGQVLVALGRNQALDDWQIHRPADCPAYADYWLTMGDIAATKNQVAEACRLYLRALLQDPNYLPAWDRLRLSMKRLASSSEDVPKELDGILKTVDDQSRKLLLLRERFNTFAADGQSSQSAATAVAQSLFELDRVWEAEAWSAIATTLKQSPSSDLPTLRKRILDRLSQDQSWISKNHPAYRMDLAFLDRLEKMNRSVNEIVEESPTVMRDGLLRLHDKSLEWDLLAVGTGNQPDNAALAPLIRSTGVGGGAIDYDLDGVPDVVIANAGGTMLEKNSSPNQLLRNSGERFVDVSGVSGIQDRGFGQGVAIGDFNEDGFPDVFFANLGPNCLYRNNGDGTFTECTSNVIPDTSSRWSTSAAFADINGDSLSDLIVTNYCQVTSSLSEPCLNELNQAGPCHPLRFSGDTDQFYLISATGSLSEIELPPSAKVPGRGLGIVAGALAGKGMSIYIANDMSPNVFYSTNRQASFLEETAIAQGLAVDGRSLSQASMGIAASDFDLDGDLDFYVTGFAREYNVFYEQVAAGLWSDSTARLGLVNPTLMTVGFGAQAIDLDGDGFDEIAVTNGHIGQFSDPESPSYEQPFQLFRRNQAGLYGEVSGCGVGEYFEDDHVGRALWTLDVNRDGRRDIMITHADEHVCLLVNESPDTNNRIRLQLVGTRCSRDGVGAIVRFKCDGRRRVNWLLSGDGYFCSNEKGIVAGLANASEITDVEIVWNDGSVDRIPKLMANTEYLVVQGQPPFELDQYRRQ